MSSGNMAGVSTRSSACSVCKIKLRKNDDSIVCRKCQKAHHVECAGVELDKYLEIRESAEIETWMCSSCEDITSKGVDTTVSNVDKIQLDGPENSALPGDNASRCCCSSLPSIGCEIEKLYSIIRLQSEQISELKQYISVQLSEVKSLLQAEHRNQVTPTLMSEIVKDRQPAVRVPPEPLRSRHNGKQETAVHIRRQHGEMKSPQQQPVRTVNVEPGSSSSLENTTTTTATTSSSTMGSVQIQNNTINTPLEGVDVNIATNTTDRRNARGNWRHREPAPVTVGTCTESSEFGAVARRAWIYVGRVRSGTTSDNVVKHLKEKCPDVDFHVEALRSDDESCSFKVGFDFEKLDLVSDARVWPRNVVVRRFNIRKPFFRKYSEGNKNERS